jgi:uncharacterized membrane protein
MNFEIIPNWHPIFVHFSIALLSISTALLIIGKFTPQKYLWRNAAFTVSKWNLLIGATISIITVLAGWYAYNTVNHDEPSHIAMTSHMKWALGTFSLFVVVAIWSFIQRKREAGFLLVGFQLFATFMLLVTGFKGGELVYRHGLGVLSLPEAEANEGSEHHHDHGSHKHGKNENPSDEKADIQKDKIDSAPVKKSKKSTPKTNAVKQNNKPAVSEDSEEENHDHKHHHDHEE